MDAACPGRHDVLQSLEQIDLTLCFKRFLELVVTVEVIFDGAFRASSDEYEFAGARCERLFSGVLDERLVDDRQHLFRACLRRGKKPRAAPRHWKYCCPDFFRLTHA